MQKILVVDDAEINRELLREFLEVDYIVETAENGGQALLRAQHGEISALLLDLHMRIQTALRSLSRCGNRGGWSAFRC